MNDAHDLHVLNDLISAIRSTAGAPPEAATELETFEGGLSPAGEGGGGGGSGVLEAARDAIGGLLGGRPAAPATGASGHAAALEALMARLEAAKADDRLSGPARDAVIRAFDPIKAARDAALQGEAG